MRPPVRHFPKVAADGTFLIRVIFASSTDEPVEVVRSWLASWISEHSDWPAFGVPRPFGDYFSAPPEAGLGDAGELTLLLRGIGDNGEKRFWKDWYLRICNAIRAKFLGVGEVVRVENVEAA